MRQTQKEQELDLDRVVLVPLDEVARFCGGTAANAEQFAKEFGVTVRSNWAGEPAVTPSDAARMKAEYAARWERIHAREAAFEAWREARETAFRQQREAEARKQREQQERELAAAAVERRTELQERHRREQERRQEERARYEPDTSYEAFQREQPHRVTE